jgi:phosphoglycolate phosphatase-like HAD superfamily hydrolase
MFTKDYTLSTEAQSSHLFAHVSGIRTRESVMGVTMEVFDSAIANRLSKVLVDVRAFEGRLGILEVYLLVTELFQKLRGKGLKQAAIVDRPQPGTREWFLETVAINRGFNFRIFPEVEEALQWLLADTDTDE